MRFLLFAMLFGFVVAAEEVPAACMDSTWVIGPGSLNADFGCGIALSADSNVVFGGYYDLTGLTQGYGWIIKSNPENGSQFWSKTYSVGGAQSVFLDIAPTEDGGFICGGWYRVPITNDQQYWLFRANASGDSVWSRTYGHNFANQGRTVVQAADGGFAIAGRAHSLPGGYGETDWWILKTTANGDSSWSQIIGGPLEDTCLDMILTANGNYLLVGYSLTDSTREGRAAEISADGAVLWTHAYSPDVSVEIRSAVIAGDGYLLCGSVTPTNGTNDVLLIQIDLSGNELWHRTINLLPGRNDVATTIRSGDNGSYYLFGHGYRSGTTEKDVFAMRVSACGDTLRTVWVGNAVDEEIADATVTSGGMLVTSGVARLSSTQYELQGYGISADTCNGRPCPFERTAPADSSLVETAARILFTWTPATDPDRDSLHYIFHAESNYTFSLTPADTMTADTFVWVAVPIPVENLDELFDFHWTVRVTDGADTVDALNGDGYFRMDIPPNSAESAVLPATFKLTAHPNPFNARTTLAFTLSRSERLSLVLYDLHGRIVQTLLDQNLPAGTHAISFDGGALASGIYYAALRTPAQTEIAKLVLLK